MKVFVSSLISGMEEERAAAKRAIEVLGHEPVMAEEFGARASSPQVACLQGVREADAVVLILGPRYGAKQSSGMSATHEEYLEARGRKSILAFVQEGDRDEDQAALIKEAGGWQGGLLWNGFSTPEQLGGLVTQNLHRHELAHAVAPLEPEALARIAPALLPERTNNYYSSDLALHLAIAAGPRGDILRPAELEAEALASAMQQQAMFAPAPIFDKKLGADSRFREDALVIYQGRDHVARAEVQLWQTGDLRLILPLSQEGRGMGLPVVIEEDVASCLAAGLAYAAWLLDQVDPTQRITHIALAAALVGQGGMGWRTREEHAASPNSGSLGGWDDQDRDRPVMLTPPHRVRAVLTMDAQRVVEDLVVLLRRRRKNNER